MSGVRVPVETAGNIAAVSAVSNNQRLATCLEPEQAALIESQVGEILASVPGRIWDGREPPVPVEVIAREVYGLRVLMKSGDEMREAAGRPADDPVEVSGLLLTGIGEIWVNSWEAEQSWGNPRTRFTIGHELGHFVMHQASRAGIYCRANTEDDDQVDEPALEPVPRTIPEVEANTFSAALLMPSGLMRERLRSEGDSPDVGMIQREFIVSRKASIRRIEALRQLTA